MQGQLWAKLFTEFYEGKRAVGMPRAGNRGQEVPKVVLVERAGEGRVPVSLGGRVSGRRGRAPVSAHQR